MGPAALATAVALTWSSIVPASAQDWPARPIRIVLGFGAGGGTDIATRIIVEPLGELLGQRIVVENKPGAGGSIAADSVAKAEPDGYAALMATAAHTTTAVMLKALPYDPVKDFAPVGMVMVSFISIAVHKDSPAKDLRRLIESAKEAAPRRLNYSTVGLGSIQHFAGELLQQMTGTSAQHVPYRTTPEIVAALLRRDTDFAVEIAHPLAGQVRSGELRLLAVTNGARAPSFPDVPTVAESGVPGYEVFGWNALMFPARTPQAVIDKTAKALRDVLARDSVRRQLSNAGVLPTSSTPHELNEHVAREIAKWKVVADKANLK
jgi:tripartite-type tricarboxylate transporter receptor subunit TctC